MKLLCYVGAMVFGYVVSVLFRFQNTEWIKDVILPILGVLAGVLVGAVGVFLGGLGNVVAAISGSCNECGFDRYLKKLDNTVNELKGNIIFCLCSTACCVFLYFVINVDIPYIDWPWDGNLFGKSVICSAFVVGGFVLCFCAIIDSVVAMFEIYKQYALIVGAVKR